MPICIAVCRAGEIGAMHNSVIWSRAHPAWATGGEAAGGVAVEDHREGAIQAADLCISLSYPSLPTRGPRLRDASALPYSKLRLISAMMNGDPSNKEPADADGPHGKGTCCFQAQTERDTPCRWRSGPLESVFQGGGNTRMVGWQLRWVAAWSHWVSRHGPAIMVPTWLICCCFPGQQLFREGWGEEDVIYGERPF